MGADATAIFVPGHGTVFVADTSASFPANPLAAFTLTGTPPTGWTSIGHTSKDNTAAFSKDGGDSTSLDTWLADAVRTVYSALAWALTVNALQLDTVNLGLAFNGASDTDGGYIVPGSNNGLTKQVFLLATDGSASLGFWMPNTSVLLGDAPSIDPTKFFELPLSVSINAADVAKIPAVNGVAGIMKIYKSSLVTPPPLIVSALPSAAAQGNIVTITGSGFLGATAVKFGAVNATSFVVNGDGSVVYAVMPAGSAGSAPVTVITPAGTSNAQAYTRGA